MQEIQEVKIQLSNQALEHQSNKEAILEKIRVVKEMTEWSHADKELLIEKYNKKRVDLKEMQLMKKNLSLEIKKTQMDVNQLKPDLELRNQKKE